MKVVSGMNLKNNPIIYSDFPDIDILRVEDTYYMVSTTMHFMPGCSILKSYDLLNWELVSHVYEMLDNTPSQRLDEGNIYGQGMWAPSFRYHNGTFYLCFAANDTKKTYLFTTTDITGEWKKSHIDGFYHDSSLLFDGDQVYLVYGNRDIHLLELNEDLSGPKEGGLSRILISDTISSGLAYEGAHLQKINNKYYLFVINWPPTGTGRRKEWCFIADSLTDEFSGKCIIDDDLGFYNQGVAQGGVVDTPDGDWYMFMFQDRGAVGRVPILMPIRFVNDFPVIKGGHIPVALSIDSTKPNYEYQPLVGSDDFTHEEGEKLKPFWQFNHQPNNEFWSVTDKYGAFRITTDRVVKNLTQGINTLTQRTTGPVCSASVILDASQINEGDYAGLAALQGSYAAIAVTKKDGKFELVMFNRPGDYEAVIGSVNDVDPPVVHETITIDDPIITLKIAADFTNLKDEVTFSYLKNNEYRNFGITHPLHYKLDHFVGCRFALFAYSTKTIGGVADFLDFDYETC